METDERDDRGIETDERDERGKETDEWDCTEIRDGREMTNGKNRQTREDELREDEQGQVLD